MRMLKLCVGAVFALYLGGLHSEENLNTPLPSAENIPSSHKNLLPATEGYDALQEVLDEVPTAQLPEFSKEAKEFITEDPPLFYEGDPEAANPHFPNTADSASLQHLDVAPVPQMTKPHDELEEGPPKRVVVDLNAAFAASPIIYSILLAMSVFALFTWLYTLICIKKETGISPILYHDLQNKLSSNLYDEALLLCQNRSMLMCKMLSSGIACRRHGLPVILETMKTEGRRNSAHFWQKISTLNDIAIIAPLLGLLGTVLGMFYAFYDVNRSTESVSMLFDGLGVSVGTTVAGLIVSIMALLLHSTAKHRLMSSLIKVENEAQLLASFMESRAQLVGER